MKNQNPSILWTGAITDVSGYASATREYIHSLLEVNVDVTSDIRSFEPWRPQYLVDQIVSRKIWKTIKTNSYPKVQVIHLTPDLFLEYKNNMYLRIGLFAWETDRIPQPWVYAINNSLHELWVPSYYTKRACELSYVTIPIYIIPHAIPYVDLEETTETTIDGLNKNHLNFYSIFQWSERKNPKGLLEAYFRAFTKDDNVTLVLKTYKKTGASEEKKLIQHEILSLRQKYNPKNYPRVLLIEEFLSTSDLNALHLHCDCNITMTRSEGFGLPTFEAMSHGNAVIAPKYSAYADFLTSEVSYLIDLEKEIQVKGMEHISPLYSPNMKWGEPSIQSCIEQMRNIYDDKEQCSEIAKNGLEFVRGNFSYRAIGQLMKERITKLLDP
jgi:glycosyltransferase involved in cell wall biosynthesis